ncbi:helix-turn-helix domain-containing protein [Micromonospora sp. WMMD1082]|uniref:helix-turn-helix domain-containing protein n=1 Tax=Micromonospora sp. WMMD1082 TaxID=3016104 RepID=UPI002416B3D6|nr:helix-turn-helix domain-containing protein [Micromonospora sp. WMMD1082]MDG4792739.1 helix-turn-helix domain containing protein [Micromonospora sp. WMMD1082]
MSRSPAPTGRGWAYLGAVLGGALSIAANVEHSFIGNDNPPVLQVVFSVAWPVLLFVGIEVLARVAFPKGFGYALLRFVGVGGVALVAAIVSYKHMSGLFEHYGADAVTVTYGPIAIDGLLAVCSAALILTAQKRARTEEAPPAPAQADLDAEFRAWADELSAAPPQAVAIAQPAAAPAPTKHTPEPVEAVSNSHSGPEDAEQADAPADPRMVTALTFGPLPEPGDAARYPEIRRRAEALNAEDASRSQQNIADLIGVPRRTLRDALAATAPKPVDPPKLRVLTTQPS